LLTHHKEIAAKFRSLWSWTPKHYSSCQCSLECPCQEIERISLSFEWQPQLNNFDLIADEILLQVLQFSVTSWSSLVTVSLTCKHLYTLLQDPWLQPNHKKDAKKIIDLSKLTQKILELSDQFCHGCHTCNLESFHSQRIQFASKEKNYWKSWPARSLMAVSIHNMGMAEFLKKLYQELKLSFTRVTASSTKEKKSYSTRRKGEVSCLCSMECQNS